MLTAPQGLGSFIDIFYDKIIKTMIDVSCKKLINQIKDIIQQNTKRLQVGTNVAKQFKPSQQMHSPSGMKLANLEKPF